AWRPPRSLRHLAPISCCSTRRSWVPPLLVLDFSTAARALCRSARRARSIAPGRVRIGHDRRVVHVTPVRRACAGISVLIHGPEREHRPCQLLWCARLRRNYLEKETDSCGRSPARQAALARSGARVRQNDAFLASATRL